MAKSRVTVNSEEAKLVEQARELSKLRARRRQKVDELAGLDKQIEATQKEVNRLSAGASVEP